MNRGLSIWLDVLRSAAALAVLFGHLAHVRFTGGDYYVLREMNIASDAVVVFFVISGLVIAYAADRDGSPGLYAFNRVTRLLSVIVPALVLTAIFDAVGTRLDPAAYPAPYYQPAGPENFLLRGLTLSTEWTGFLDRVRLGTNGPLWSLSYEAAYYVLFGVAVFCRGWLRIGLIGLVALFVGLPILVLMPAWMLGVFVWKKVADAERKPARPTTALTLAILPIALLIVARAAGIPQALSDLTAYALAPASHHALLGYSDEVLWNLAIALAVSLHLVGVIDLVRGRSFSENSRPVRAIRWFAGATFSIYAVHYPVLHLLDAVLPQNLPGHNAVMLAATLAVCLFFARLFERPIRPIRKALAGIAGIEPRAGRDGPASGDLRLVPPRL